MNEQEPRDRQPNAYSIHATLSGDIQGQVAIGNHNRQMQIRHEASAPASPDELAEWQARMNYLRTQVEIQAPPEKKSAALERMDELEEAVTGQEPDLSTMEYVKRWFIKNLPSLAGSVASLIVHPVVGKLVETGGEALAAEFQRRLGR